jgi:lactate 2-monooxygenase
MAWTGDIFSGAAHSWEELAHLREHWEGPIVLKGIQDPDDAIKAVEHGMDGIFVSNHGGRQVDGAVGSLEMLPECVEAVKGRKGGIGEDFVVMFDSGIRTGADIVKAICLGARMVGIGRPWVYGLGINGKIGARDALRGILADCDQLMGLAGLQSLSDCKPKVLRKCVYPGDVSHVN